MAKLEAIVTVHKCYALFLFPVATYRSAGEAAILTIFGMPVYKRIGKVSSILGWVRHAA